MENLQANSILTVGQPVVRVNPKKAFGYEKKNQGVVGEVREYDTYTRYRVVLDTKDIHNPRAGWWFDCDEIKCA